MKQVLIPLLVLSSCLLGQACAPMPTPGSQYNAPTGAPTAPGDSFCSTFSGTVAAGSPVIAAWNASTSPNGAMTLSGKAFSTQVGALLGTDTAVWVTNGTTVDQAEINSIPDSSTLIAIIPSGYSYGMYFLWVQNSNGISAPVAINRTNPQWIGPLGATAVSGAAKRVFGKDLGSYVYIQPTGGGSLTAATVTSVEPYAVAFTVPTLSNGTYNVYVHNGHGGSWGWGAPLVLTIATPFSRGMTSSTVSASGGDDAAAINAAITTQNGNSNGGTVNLNAGTYTIKAAHLELLANVALVGAGSGSTTLNVALTSSGIKNAIEIAGNNVAMQGINVVLINDGTTQLPTFLAGAASYPASFSNISWNDLIWTANDSGGSTENINVNLFAVGFEVNNCVFYRDFAPTQSDLWVHNSTFHGGEFQGTNLGTASAISLQAIQRVVIESNSFSTPSYPPSAGQNIVRRMFVASGNSSSIQNLYIAHNTGTNVAPATGENSGEIMLFHGEATDWYGQVVSNTGTTMTVLTNCQINGSTVTINNYGGSSYCGTISDPLTTNGTNPIVLPSSGAFGNVGMFASIVSGTGRGQIRPVTAVTSNTITVASAWLLPPDSTSLVVLGYAYMNGVMYQNNITAFPSVGSFTNSGASQLVDCDGNCWFMVADSNTGTHTFNAATIAADSLNQSQWNVFQNNTFNTLQNIGMSLIYWSGYSNGGTAVLLGPVTLGNVFRGNTVQLTTVAPSVNGSIQDTYYQIGSIGGIFAVGTITAPFPYHESNIFENNTGTGTRHGIWAGDYADTLYRGNNLTVSDGSAPNPVYIREAGLPFFNGNTYAGGGTTYVVMAGGSYASNLTPLYPGLYLKAKYGTSATFNDVVLRSGVAGASYTTSASQSWISLTNPTGTISAEQSGSFPVVVNASALTPGTYSGIVTISDGTNSFDLGVSLLVYGGGTASAGPKSTYGPTSRY